MLRRHVMPRSSAAVGCAVATFDLIQIQLTPHKPHPEHHQKPTASHQHPLISPLRHKRPPPAYSSRHKSVPPQVSHKVTHQEYRSSKQAGLKPHKNQPRPCRQPPQPEIRMRYRRDHTGSKWALKHTTAPRKGGMFPFLDS